MKTGFWNERPIRIFLSLSCVGVFLAGAASVHQVQEHETLSEIAAKNFSGTVYGKTGSLAKLLALNPHIQNPNFIKQGDVVFLETESTVVFTDEVVPLVAGETFVPRGLATEEEPEPKSHFTLGSGLEYFRLDATDRDTGGTSTLLSSATWTAHVAWNLYWNEFWSSRVGVNYQSEKILADDTAGAATLRDATGSRFGFQAGVIRHRPSRATQAALFVGYQEKIFSHSPSASILSLDRVGIPYVRLQQDMALLELKSAAIGLSLSGDYLFSSDATSYSVESGYGGMAAVYMRHYLKNYGIEAKVYYAFEKQDTSLATQDNTSVGALLNYSWELGQ